MASNREYWIKRMQHREAVSYTNGLEAMAGLLREYKKAASSIRKEINDFYARYAGENGLTFEQAMQDMSRADLQEWRGTVGEYIRRIQQEPNPQIRERLMREYDARSYNSRISRLDGLCGNIEMNVNNLYARADEQFRQLLGEEYTGGYYRAMYDLQTRLGYNGQFSTITREMVENTLAYPWSGANFSDRLWRNKTALVDTIRETLTQGMIRGDNIRDMSRAVADKLNSSYRNAERLVRTETSHIHNTAEIAAYEAAGYEEYEFMASFGERTCEVCGGLDGQHFKLTDIQYGVNFPPVHPNCRCTTVGWEPEEKELPEGEQREEISYEDWYGKYVEGREKQYLSSVLPQHKNLTKIDYCSIIDKKERDKLFRDNLLSGNVDIRLDTKNQPKHIFGIAWYNKVMQALKKGTYPRSVLDPQYSPETLIERYAGKGELRWYLGSNYPDEFVELNYPVGLCYNTRTRTAEPTNILQIRYGPNGVHVFPTNTMPDKG